MMSDPMYNAVPPERKDPPCELDGCRFEDRCGRSPQECGERMDSLADWAVDAAIEEARLKRKERQ